MNLLQIALWAVVGYLIDIALNILVVRFLLRTDATVSSVAFFEWIHDTVTFACGLFLGLSVLSISVSDIGYSLLFTGLWTIASFFMAKIVLGLESNGKVLVFLGIDTVFDYGLGGLASVPAGLSLLSTVPVASTSATANASPLSLRPVIVIVGAIILFVTIAIRKSRGEDADIITDES
ncbi:MAG: hypothetical protein JRN15_08005 [Nitrososphaerota archaeon]|nr:hypothetical protein [Nitrososphaerota archaeon]